MGYSTGLMRQRVTFYQRTTATQNEYGLDAAGITWEEAATVWAAVDWTRGAKALHEGAVDAYEVLMIRCRYNSNINRDCLVLYDGRYYEIESCHRDYHENTIQITCRERPNQNITISS